MSLEQLLLQTFGPPGLIILVLLVAVKTLFNGWIRFMQEEIKAGRAEREIMTNHVVSTLTAIEGKLGEQGQYLAQQTMVLSKIIEELYRKPHDV